MNTACRFAALALRIESRTDVNLCRHGLLIALLLFGATLAFGAAPPANDNCANAEIIPAAGPFPYLTPPIYDVSGATEVGDPIEFECSLARQPTNSVWYSFTPEIAGTYAFSTAGGTLTYTNLDTVLGVYTAPGGCGFPGEFVLVNCNNDVAEEIRAKLFATLEAGQTYLIYAALFETYTFEGGTNTLQLLVERRTPPANDVCANAEVIPTDAILPYLTAVHDIAAAGIQEVVTVPGCQPDAIRSVWFKFEPPVTSRYAVSTCSELTGTLVGDTVMAVYEAPEGCDGPLTEIACVDDDETGTCQELNLQSHAMTLLNAGTPYFIVVWQWYSPEFSVIDEVHPGESLVQLYLADLNPRIVLSIEPAGEGFYQIEFTGNADQVYEVQGSNDLVQWDVLGMAIYNPTTGRFSFFHDTFDPITGKDRPRHFYRIRSL